MATYGITTRWLYNDLPLIAAMIDDAAKETIGRYGMALRDQAKVNQEPHIDTGALNASGEVEGQGSDTVRVVFTGGAVNRSGEARIYAAYHEYGTRFTGAYPFLTPAVDQTFPDGVYPIAIAVFGAMF